MAEFPVDRDLIAQDELDLRVRERTSLYPWRGQFSPGLVASLLEAYAEDDDVILDPFVGSGTTLFEATRLGFACFGAEVNPTAALLAGMARFAVLPPARRQSILKDTARLLERQLAAHRPPDMFGASEPNGTLAQAVTELLQDSGEHPWRYNLLAASVLLAMGNGDRLTTTALERAFARNGSVVRSLPESDQACAVALTDARALPLAEASVDLAITSPPYINVFNYHQNYRPAAELMGWRPLESARSEIGANRKHRGNRFLTVVQFCMDLTQVLLELKRVLRPEGRAVFVVGRESQVRGVAFDNGRLLALCATGGAGFRLLRRQERSFTTRFGESIYEDIYALEPNDRPLAAAGDFGRRVGLHALEMALEAAMGEVAKDIEAAINRGKEIEPSPLLKPFIPHPPGPFPSGATLEVEAEQPA